MKYTFTVSGVIEADSHNKAYAKIREAVVLGDFWLDDFELSIKQKTEPAKVGFQT